MMESGLRDWNDLTPQEQLDLREACGHYLDGLPRTCDLQEKHRRFAEWLRGKGVRYNPG